MENYDSIYVHICKEWTDCIRYTVCIERGGHIASLCSTAFCTFARLQEYFAQVEICRVHQDWHEAEGND